MAKNSYFERRSDRKIKASQNRKLHLGEIGLLLSKYPQRVENIICYNI